MTIEDETIVNSIKLIEKTTEDITRKVNTVCNQKISSGKEEFTLHLTRIENILSDFRENISKNSSKLVEEIKHVEQGKSERENNQDTFNFKTKVDNLSISNTRFQERIKYDLKELISELENLLDSVKEYFQDLVNDLDYYISEGYSSPGPIAKKFETLNDSFKNLSHFFLK